MNNRAVLLFFTHTLVPTSDASGIPGPFETCLDYHCDLKQTIQLSQIDWQRIQQLFNSPSDSPQTEPKQIGYHHVEPRAVRTPWVYSTHWIAVIKETGTLQKYAVDSWFFANTSALLSSHLTLGWLPKSLNRNNYD